MHQNVPLRTINCHGKGAALKKLFVMTAVVFAVSACQSPDMTQSSADSNIQYLDLSAPSKQSLTDNYWQVKFRKEPKYPIQAAVDRLSGCAELIIGINSDGKVAHYKVIKSYPAGVFDQKSAEALLGWRYAAAPSNQNLQPVLTTVQLDFMVTNSKNSAEAAAKCTKTKTIAAVSGT